MLKHMCKALSPNGSCACVKNANCAYQMSTCSHNKVMQEKNLHIKKPYITIPSLDAQMQEGGAAARKEVFLQATGGLATTGQLVDSPK